MADLAVFVSAEVTTFAGSGEPGFYDDVGIKAKMTNPQQLEIDNMKRRLFLSDTVSCIGEVYKRPRLLVSLDIIICIHFTVYLSTLELVSAQISHEVFWNIARVPHLLQNRISQTLVSQYTFWWCFSLFQNRFTFGAINKVWIFFETNCIANQTLYGWTEIKYTLYLIKLFHK